MHEQLAAHDLYLKKTGRGLNVTNGKRDAKCSAFGRAYSLKGLEKRFGAYAERQQTGPQERSREEGRKTGDRAGETGRTARPANRRAALAELNATYRVKRQTVKEENWQQCELPNAARRRELEKIESRMQTGGMLYRLRQEKKDRLRAQSLRALIRSADTQMHERMQRLKQNYLTERARIEEHFREPEARRQPARPADRQSSPARRTPAADGQRTRTASASAHAQPAERQRKDDKQGKEWRIERERARITFSLNTAQDHRRDALTELNTRHAQRLATVEEQNRELYGNRNAAARRELHDIRSRQKKGGLLYRLTGAEQDRERATELRQSIRDGAERAKERIQAVQRAYTEEKRQIDSRYADTTRDIDRRKLRIEFKATQMERQPQRRAQDAPQRDASNDNRSRQPERDASRSAPQRHGPQRTRER